MKSSTEIRNAHDGVSGGNGGGEGAKVAGSVVEKVLFCPRMENVLASTGGDGCVRLWDVRVPGAAGAAAVGKGTQLASCGISDSGLFLTWHPNGTELLVGTKEDEVHSVDVRRMGALEDEMGSVQWTMDSTNRTPGGLKPSSHFYGMTFSPSGHELFATTGDGPVKIFDYPSMASLHTLSAHMYASYAVSYSPRGDWLAVGGQDSMITLWDTLDWHCYAPLTAHTGPVRTLSFSFDGNYLVAGCGSDAKEHGEKGLQVYHVDTGEVAHTIETVNAVTVVEWHPLRYWVAYAGDPGGLKVVGAGSSV